MRAKDAGDIILIVDDSPDTLRMLTDALEEAGMTALVALEGDQALAIVAKITPDIILMDAVGWGQKVMFNCNCPG
jgi:DNA-binding response OmpR family regulator